MWGFSGGLVGVSTSHLAPIGGAFLPVLQVISVNAPSFPGVRWGLTMTSVLWFVTFLIETLKLHANP